MKYLYLLCLLSLSIISFSQEDCIELFCSDEVFLNQQIENINAEIAQMGTDGFCNPGTIQQCFFQGQPVYATLGSPYICNPGVTVFSCFGTPLFAFICESGPCLDQNEANGLEGCITLYTTSATDNVFCDTNNFSDAQINCAKPLCAAFDQIQADLLNPAFNPPDPDSNCVPTQTLSQCDYRGISVIVQSPGTCRLADEPFTVYDCTADFLFSFGGFCFTQNGDPCPGDIEAQFISNCQVIFSVQDGKLIECFDAEMTSTIPTMGEWGLITLSLLLLIFGIILIKDTIPLVLN